MGLLTIEQDSLRFAMRLHSRSLLLLFSVFLSLHNVINCTIEENRPLLHTYRGPESDWKHNSPILTAGAVADAQDRSTNPFILATSSLSIKNGERLKTGTLSGSDTTDIAKTITTAHRQLLAKSSPSTAPYSLLGASLAFNAMAYLTGSLGADSALPPSKVADYFGSERFLLALEAADDGKSSVTRAKSSSTSSVKSVGQEPIDESAVTKTKTTTGKRVISLHGYRLDVKLVNVEEEKENKRFYTEGHLPLSTNKRNSESLNDIRRRISEVVLPMLSATQRTALISLTRTQSTLMHAFTAKRLNLIQAFRKLSDSSLQSPSSSGAAGGRQVGVPTLTTTTGGGSSNLTRTLNLKLNLTSIVQTSAEIYALDGQIALERAMIYADIINSFSPAQRVYLHELSDARPVSSWTLLASTTPIRSDIRGDPNRDHHHEMTEGDLEGLRDPIEGLPDAAKLALAGYATDIVAWLNGDISRDAYLAPDRIAPYFGGLYLKHTSSIWRDVSLLEFPGEDAVASAIRKALSPYQLSILDHLVAAQEGLRRSILDVRTKICTQLRSLLVEDDHDKVPHQKSRKLRHRPPYNVDDSTTAMTRSQPGSQSAGADNATAGTGTAPTAPAATGVGGTSSGSTTATTSRHRRRRLMANLQPTVVSLAKQYGRLDGEVAYLYANALAQLRGNITQDGLTQYLLQSVRDSIFNVLPNGAYHLISSIPLPVIDNNNLTDYFVTSVK